MEMNEPIPSVSNVDLPDMGAFNGESDSGYVPDLSSLSGVLSENHAALRESAGITNIVNVSTEMVEENQAFNSGDYEAQVRAQAGTAEHLKLMTMAQGNTEPLMQMTNEFTTIAATLQRVRLPDTRVKIAGQKLEGSYDCKQFSNDINQGQYNLFMRRLLGEHRMNEIRKHCTKANMAHTPALWLNQAIDYEVQKNYVYTIATSTPDAIKKIEGRLDPDTRHKTSQVLKGVLGDYLYGKLQRNSDSQQCSPYTLFVILVDQIVDRQNGVNAPKTALSIWDNVTTPVANAERPTITAEYAERMRR